MLLDGGEIREVHGIPNIERQRIMDYLQGAVYCWCKNRKGKWFATRDLLGGDNYFWDGTPLSILYDKHKSAGKDDASSIEDAGRDAGWLLKKVIAKDGREFKTRKGYTREYCWGLNESAK